MRLKMISNHNKIKKSIMSLLILTLSVSICLLSSCFIDNTKPDDNEEIVKGIEVEVIIVEGMTRFSDIIHWSAAPPGQKGVNHVNCQTPEWWEKKFNKFG